ncbi:MAG: hypothetical protein V2I33_05580 [Kangiellaceae bacterium]|jgi:hypothetical protein|nr:hypothetical protein [Kangiellaceae bacterium]
MKKIVMVISILLFSGITIADNHNRDKNLTIVPKAECATNVLVPDNCSEFQGVNGCVCSTKNKKIIWTIESEREFEIAFLDESPFDGGCRHVSNGGRLVCKVKNNAMPGAYDYDVILEGCDSGSDPRIVIK